MAEIEITLPTVQYGNVKVRVTPEEFGLQYGIDNPYALGMGAATYLNLFTQGFKEGATMDVSAPASASQEAPAPKARTINEVLSDEDVDTVAEAQAILDKELGGVTEVPDKVSEVSSNAPWTEKVDTPEKPWETDGAPAPKPVVDEGW